MQARLVALVALLVCAAVRESDAETASSSASLSAESVTPLWSDDGQVLGSGFGSAVGWGDFDDDGIGDVIVGSPLFGGGQNEILEADQGGGGFSRSLDSRGDVNGDGIDDLIVGSPYFGGGQAVEGRAHLFLGSITGLPSVPNWYVESNQELARLGESVSFAGDVRDARSSTSARPRDSRALPCGSNPTTRFPASAGRCQPATSMATRAPS